MFGRCGLWGRVKNSESMYSRREKIAATLVGQDTGWFLLSFYQGKDMEKPRKVEGVFPGRTQFFSEDFGGHWWHQT